MPSYSDGGHGCQQRKCEIWRVVKTSTDDRYCCIFFFFAFNHYCYRTTDYGITPGTMRYRRNKHGWGEGNLCRFVSFLVSAPPSHACWTCERAKFAIILRLKKRFFFFIYIFSRRRSRFRADASLIAILLTRARSNR